MIASPEPLETWLEWAYLARAAYNNATFNDLSILSAKYGWTGTELA